MNIETELARHLQRLCVDIGRRPSGSPGNHAAAEYIGRVLRAAGLEVKEQRYECPAWEHEETRLEVNGAPIKANANAFSPACDVTAPTVAVGTVAELQAADLGGRIGILYGDLARAPLSPKSWFLKSERDDHIIRLLEEKKPVALITVQAATAEFGQVIEDWQVGIPSATVLPGEGLALLKQCGASVRLQIKSRQTPGDSCNVVARTLRAGAGAGRIVLCAHYDTKMDTPGATDNGGGVATLLTLAQVLSQRKHALGLEFIAFSGEEYMPIGDDEYLRRCENQFGQIVTAINMDGVGPYLGANSITAMACSQAFHAHVAGVTQKYPGVVWVEPWPESNHSTFSFRGVPSLALSAVGVRNIAHYPTDTIDKVSPAKLAEVVSLVADIVASLQDKSLEWGREARSSLGAVAV